MLATLRKEEKAWDGESVYPSLGMAKVAVYTHESLRVKRRSDLEDSTVAAVWLECGLPNQRSILVCVGYRQWRLVGQTDDTSASTGEQLVRWLAFLDKWEKALGENKEVIVTMDANLDFLTWRKQDLPAHHSSIRLKPLIDALFDQILPLGVSQLVTGATRMERGQPRTGLDHLYTNKPEKLSSVQTHFTGMSDHKLIKFTRFTKSLKQNPRYVRKRMFKNFDEEIFKQKLSETNLDEVLACTDVDEAAELLVQKLNGVLDDMAPVKTIQTRKKYVPWLSEDAKKLQAARNTAQEKATLTDSPEDWRHYRSLRNQVTARTRADNKEWQRKQLDDKENSPTGMWRTLKSWLGWGGGGTPTQLFSEGRLVTSPGGLASCMNKFFLDKVRNLRSSVPTVQTDPLEKMKQAMQGRRSSFKLKTVSIVDVIKVISNLKNSSATGVDYIDTRTVKLSSEILAPALTHIINLSITTNTFPSIWKFAKVIPLLKSLSADPILHKKLFTSGYPPNPIKSTRKCCVHPAGIILGGKQSHPPNLHGSRAGHNTSTPLIQLSAAFDICDHSLLVGQHSSAVVFRAMHSLVMLHISILVTD